MAEALLEECLLENMDLLRSSRPLVDKTQGRLCKAKGYLNTILSRGRLTPRYLNEALLLMAKVHYVQGRFRDAQGMCARVGLEELTQDDQPVYHYRLLAEAFVIKGLSLDHQTLSAVSRIRLSEREEESLSCFLKACDAALSYLQELDKMVTTPHAKMGKGSFLSAAVDVDLGYFLQAALQSAYLCLLQRGHLAQGAHQLRRVLRVVESRGSQSFRKWVGAVSVLKECARMRPDDPSLPLLAAKICIGQLHWVNGSQHLHFKEAENLSKRVASMGEEAREFLPRAYLALGLSFSLQASEATLSADRNEFNKKALQALNKANSLDPQDAQISMYLALQLALVRQVSAAMEPLQTALSLRADDLLSLHLLTLLLSSQKHHRHALDTISLALSQHPDNFNLLLTKVKLEEAMLGPAAALQTCEEMLQRWQSQYDVSRSSETDDSSSTPVAERSEVSPVVRKASIHLNLPDFQDASTGSLSPPSVAVSRLEAALSEVSDLSSTRRQGPTYIWATLEHIWLQAGRTSQHMTRSHVFRTNCSGISWKIRFSDFPERSAPSPPNTIQKTPGEKLKRSQLAESRSASLTGQMCSQRDVAALKTQHGSFYLKPVSAPRRQSHLFLFCFCCGHIVCQWPIYSAPP
ncbi:hypothetical protein CCH79_00001397 [Gambusia affinis]|uniref:Tetratricopeptide repeat protein 7 N-terminal domain-containing protein n=1 Tax=Gambusia affinis TaxID=33528 RepID=A0A315VR81_GAMAF|nr:hypothetical protein CCH79_00001397 [Gambusia affinis]